MFIGEIAAAMGFAKSTVAATLQAHANCGPPPKKTPTANGFCKVHCGCNPASPRQLWPPSQEDPNCPYFN
ncbi:hypothetical protein DSO57_1018192 [Entomophthora muscae]|uniref:Uncharacterized protein n=1 Tax=Entomophthora muscae TaxID=34485 RepID=A0ACC2RIW8_9FUNG|nr:hypothetical protein DSO57_1018192 [Entomophthora muscae]